MSKSATGTLWVSHWNSFISFWLLTVQQRRTLGAVQVHISNICGDPKPLHRTPRTSPALEMYNGKCIHMDLQSSDRRQSPRMNPPPHAMNLQLIFGCTTVFCFLNRQLWPIFARILESLALTVGFHCGKNKPSSISDFLNGCISEVNWAINDNTSWHQICGVHSFFRGPWYTSVCFHLSSEGTDEFIWPLHPMWILLWQADDVPLHKVQTSR